MGDTFLTSRYYYPVRPAAATSHHLPRLRCNLDQERFGDRGDTDTAQVICYRCVAVVAVVAVVDVIDVMDVLASAGSYRRSADGASLL